MPMINVCLLIVYKFDYHVYMTDKKLYCVLAAVHMAYTYYLPGVRKSAFGLM